MPSSRISIRLPKDHFIWQFPPGERSLKLRQYLDLGWNVGEKLSVISNKLDSLETLGFSPMNTNPATKRTCSAKTSEIQFDTDAFQNL